MSTQTVYANISTGRLAARVATDDASLVSVWIPNGPVLGFYKLSRFGGALSSKRLARLFEAKCAGCFHATGGRYKGCPTRQNGTPNYN